MSFLSVNTASWACVLSEFSSWLKIWVQEGMKLFKSARSQCEVLIRLHFGLSVKTSAAVVAHYLDFTETHLMPSWWPQWKWAVSRLKNSASGGLMLRWPFEWLRNWKWPWWKCFNKTSVPFKVLSSAFKFHACQWNFVSSHLGMKTVRLKIVI